ncbi:carboxypeptidase regulatory-like domain-containing protein [Candidatus Sumerlaeota bacterium]|nr:carboxypeptidase regulatory-like domain-containing protein [Candidatus Sumerlaeota bacterium]
MKNHWTSLGMFLLIFCLAVQASWTEYEFRGEVVDEATSEPIDEFRLAYGQLPPFELRDESGRTVNVTKGRFRVRLPESGLVSVKVEAEGYAPATAAHVFQPDDQASALHVFRLHRGEPLTLRIMDALSDKPLEGVPIVWTRYMPGPNDRPILKRDLHRLESHPRMNGFQYVLSDANGEAQFIESILAPGCLAFRYDGSLQTHERRWIQPKERNAFITDDQGRLVISLKPCGMLDGEFFPESAQAKTVVVFRRLDALPGEESAIVAEHPGKLENVMLDPGYYVAIVPVPDVTTGKCDVEWPFELKPGERKTGVIIGEGMGERTLHGRTLLEGEPLPDFRFVLRPQFEWKYMRICYRSDADGEFEFRRMPEGMWTLDKDARLERHVLLFERRQDGAIQSRMEKRSLLLSALTQEQPSSLRLEDGVSLKPAGGCGEPRDFLENCAMLLIDRRKELFCPLRIEQSEPIQLKEDMQWDVNLIIDTRTQ